MGKSKGIQSCACGGSHEEWREAVMSGCAHNNVYLKCGPWMLRWSTMTTTSIRPFLDFLQRFCVLWIASGLHRRSSCCSGICIVSRELQDLLEEWTMQGNRQLHGAVRTILKAQCLTAPRYCYLISSIVLLNRTTKTLINRYTQLYAAKQARSDCRLHSRL